MSSRKWLFWSGLEAHINFFENWTQWCITDFNPTPYFKIAHWSSVKTETSWIYISQLDLDQLTKIINMLRVGTPQTFIFKNWTQWCITGLKFTPHFKYSTILCCQNRDMFIIDIPNRDRSFHENNQHFQGWNTTTIFWKSQKLKKIWKSKNGLKFYLDVCWLSLFCKTPIYIKISVYLAQRLWALQRNKNWNFHH